MAVSLLVVFTQLSIVPFSADPSRHGRPGRGPGDVLALLRRRDHPQPAGVDRRPSTRRRRATWAPPRWAALRLVLLPLLMPAILASMLIVFALSIDDFVVTQYMSSNRLDDDDPDVPVLQRARRHEHAGAQRAGDDPRRHHAARRSRSRYSSTRCSGARTAASRGGRLTACASSPGMEALMARRGRAARADQALRRGDRGRRHRRLDQRRRVLLAARPVGLRQDDDAADDRRLRAADRGRDPARRRRRRPGAPAPPQRPHGVPELRAVPAPERVRQRRLRAAPPKVAKGEVRRRVQEALELVELGGLGQPPPAAALRRPAAARRAGAGARPAPGGAAARRAARRAGRQDPQAAAPRAQGAAGGGRDHVRVRHPRPGGGARA